tara:strand:- start:189 stop:518 length:330 start_codon:yes stop_codon:yes gene_type:complete
LCAKKNATFDEFRADDDPSAINLVNIWETDMDAALERRVSVATCWASTRIAVLDSAERYEDSYALTQEFQEWITCLGEHPEMLEDSVMSVKQAPGKSKHLHFGHTAEEN